MLYSLEYIVLCSIEYGAFIDDSTLYSIESSAVLLYASYSL